MSLFLQEDGGDAAQLPVQAGGGGGGHRLLLLPQHRRGVHRYLQVILFFCATILYKKMFKYRRKKNSVLRIRTNLLGSDAN